MTIFGLGIDIIEIGRFELAFKRRGERLLKKFFVQEEMAYCNQHKNYIPHLAARFSAKEAVAKALGVGIGASIAWHEIIIFHNQNKAPHVKISGKGKKFLAKNGIKAIKLSITHSRETAAVVAIALV